MVLLVCVIDRMTDGVVLCVGGFYSDGVVVAVCVLIGFSSNSPRELTHEYFPRRESRTASGTVVIP